MDLNIPHILKTKLITRLYDRDSCDVTANALYVSFNVTVKVEDNKRSRSKVEAAWCYPNQVLLVVVFQFFPRVCREPFYEPRNVSTCQVANNIFTTQYNFGACSTRSVKKG